MSASSPELRAIEDEGEEIRSIDFHPASDAAGSPFETLDTSPFSSINVAGKEEHVINPKINAVRRRDNWTDHPVQQDTRGMRSFLL